MVMMAKPAKVHGRTELETLDIGWVFMNVPVSRRSIQSRVPTESESAITCVPSTMGNIQIDSRRLVPNWVSWSHWQISRRDMPERIQEYHTHCAHRPTRRHQAEVGLEPGVRRHHRSPGDLCDRRRAALAHDETELGMQNVEHALHALLAERAQAPDVRTPDAHAARPQ